MTNPLDSLLETLEDALEEAEIPLWQPDLTDPVLPRTEDTQAATGQNGNYEETQVSKSNILAGLFAPDTRQALSRFPWTQEGIPELSGQSSSYAQTSAQEIAAHFSSPALLERLRQLESTQAGLEALERSQTTGSSLSSRSGRGLSDAQIQPDPAALGDLSLATAAAAAWQEDQARTVDRAFQRDSRRYDRGFSLY